MDNYGGVLQCWALQKVLLDLGHQVEILNYFPATLQGKLPWWRGWRLKKRGFFRNFPKRFIRLAFGKKAERKFDDFRKNQLNLSDICYSVEEVRHVVESCDAVIVGSDQVWRFPDERVYFLDFKDKFHGRKISYAACCGSPDDGRYEPVKSLLKSMNAISVRNGFSKEIITQAIGGSVQIVADPTLLVDIDQLEQPVQDLPENYILTYIMGSEIKGGHRLVLDAIKKQVGNYPVVAIVATAQCPQFFSFADQRLYSVGPDEWVYLLKNASYIYTDSFHASLYAVKHQKPFIAYYAEQHRSARFIDLIERYSLAGYIAESAEDAIEKILFPPSSEDLHQVNALISEHINDSFEFLRSSMTFNQKQ